MFGPFEEKCLKQKMITHNPKQHCYKLLPLQVANCHGESQIKFYFSDSKFFNQTYVKTVTLPVFLLQD